MIETLKPKKINVFDWMDLTRPNQPGFTKEDKERYKAMREKVFKEAGVNVQSIVVAKSRLSIGEKLYTAVEKATQQLEPQFRINVPWSQLDPMYRKVST